ncbi:MAG: ATP-binding protein [Tannerellaceae bacterium]|nr:ATP-binding protein [Tannerellaceae bacterium]
MTNNSFFKYCIFIFLVTVFTTPLYASRNDIDFSRLDVNNGLSNNEVNAILKNRDGFIWIATSSGLNRFDGYDFRIFRNTGADINSAEANIKKICETADGNLWLYYHNNTIDIYNPRKDCFIAVADRMQQLGLDDTVLRVFSDRQGRLLYVNEKNEVIRYDYTDKEIRKFSVAAYTSPEDEVFDVYATENAYYLICNSGIILAINQHMDQLIMEDRYLASLSGDSYRIFVDSDNDIWAYPDPAFHQGVFLLDRKTRQWSNYKAGSGTIRLSSNIVRDIEEDLNGNIWVATDHGGINLIDKKNATVRCLRNSAFNPKSISQNSVVCLYKDTDGIIWAGTYKNGVNYYHESVFKFTHLKYPAVDSDEQDYNDCSSVLEDKQGNIWIGTNGGGLLCYNRATATYRSFRHNPQDPGSIGGDIIISLCADDEGNLWLGSFLNGFDKFDGKRFTHYTVESTGGKLSNHSIYSLYYDSEGNLWIGTLGGGLDRFTPRTGEWKNYNEETSGYRLLSNYVNSIFEGKNKKLYVGTTYGVNIIDLVSGEVTPLLGNTSGTQMLTSAIVNAVFEDSRNLLWIGTNNGVGIYDAARDSFFFIDKNRGMPDNKVMSIREDLQGNVWIGTRNGLGMVELRMLNGEYRYQVVCFDEGEGLQGRDFNVNSVCRNDRNELIFGGTNGLSLFNPEHIKYNYHPPKVVFTDFLINNKHIYTDTEYGGRKILEEDIAYLHDIELKYGERNFSVGFSALNYFLPDKNRFEYMMIGFDQHWVPLEGAIRRVNYTNLRPGKYTLLVRAKNNDGVLSREPSVLHITIRPPFYLTYWAIMCYFMAAAGLLYLVIAILARRQKKKFEEEQERAAIRQMHDMDEMKLRFFTNVSHEFRTPLTLILTPVERLMKRVADPEDRAILKLIHQNARQLLSMVNQLLDFRKIDVQGHTLTLSVGDIVPFIRDIVYSFKELSEHKHIRFSFSSSFTALHMKFDKDKVYKIVINLLSNAFKFTPEGGEITVHLSLRSSENQEGELLIRVLDSGIGIREEDCEKIFDRFYQSIDPEKDTHTHGTGIGLHMCKEFVKLHNGTISVESQLGKGSVFTVTLPVITTGVHEILSHPTASSTEEAVEPDIVQEKPLVTMPEGNSDQDTAKAATILLIDDNQDFRQFLALSLRDKYTILQASDAEEAWKAILQVIPDMIICDVMMPGTDGLTLCGRIKNGLRTSHIPVILLTARSADDSKLKGLEAGADDYVGKPFNMDLLQVKIQNLLDARKKMQEAVMQRADTSIRLKEIEISSLDQQLITKAVSYIEENVANPELNVERLSREMGMSRVNFYKKILAITGKTPVELIRTIRLKYAAQLLLKSQKRINEVAMDAGFNDAKLFRKYFKEEFGVLPSDYASSQSGS